ncbi:hypothetical protein [Adonisia turfae]|nr:hypothetical protein [Adonisia turfae]
MQTKLYQEYFPRYSRYLDVFIYLFLASVRSHPPPKHRSLPTELSPY